MANYHAWNPPARLWALHHTVFDFAIYGASFAGFSAARTLVRQGKKVLLIDRRPAPLHDCSWTFHQETGQETLPAWGEWLREAQDTGIAQRGQIAGAGGEILATRWLLEAQQKGLLTTLYYAAPAAADLENDRLDCLWLACKARIAPVRALRWLDASQERELAGVVARAVGASPSGFSAAGSPEVNICLRNDFWKAAPWQTATSLEGALPGLDISLMPGAWHTEAVVRISESPSCKGIAGEVPANLKGFRRWSRSCWVPALEVVRKQFGAELEGAVVSHGSVVPWRGWIDHLVYSHAENVGVVTLGEYSDTLAGRFCAGAGAAGQILDLPQGSAGTSRLPCAPPADWQTKYLANSITADIAVCGLGTGGAVAGIAAVQTGVGKQIAAFDALPFCGGIGSGGGIHAYYYGVRGGLQEDIDAEVRSVAPLFGSPGQIRGFHPEARKWVLESRLRQPGVQLHFEATLIAAESAAGRVQRAYFSTPEGIVEMNATAWIDSTGDGDLAALGAGRFAEGRDGDGLLHAFSQSSGLVGVREEKTAMHIVNYDAGYVDPTDPVDLTRGRQQGVNHYLQDTYIAESCPTYIAPAIGIRQSRQFETDYVLSLDDQLRRRAFSDAVGLTGCHYDNHAMDYDLESQEAMFLTWACRSYRKTIGGQIPYRIMLPVGLQNVWLACRAVGVSQDAHHSFRMQRDIQRLGEVAGLAAVLAPSGSSRNVPWPALQRALVESGAMKAAPDETDAFGVNAPGAEVAEPMPILPVGEALEALKSGEDGLVMWDLYELGATGPCSGEAREAVLAITANPDPDVAWRAAAIAAMWGLPEAEPVLLHRLVNFRHDTETNTGFRNRWVPYWVSSISLLRPVATPRALEALQEFALGAPPSLNLWIPLAQCVEGIAQRHELTPTERERAAALLGFLASTPVTNALAPPQHAPLTLDHGAPEAPPGGRPPVREDLSWQLDLWLLKANRALGRPYAEGLERGLADQRALVRKAFAGFVPA